MFEITRRETVHRNLWSGVVSALVRAAGAEHPYFWVEKRDSSLVIARERVSGAWVMLRCQRPTFPGEWTLEFPQGGLDAGERAEDAAERELVEETGHRVLSLRRLGVLQEAAGLATSRVHVFSAGVVRDRVPRPEPLEGQNEVVELPAADVRSALVAGRIGRRLLGGRPGLDLSQGGPGMRSDVSEVRFELDQFGNVIAFARSGRASVVLPYLRPVSDIDADARTAIITFVEGSRYRLVVTGGDVPRARELVLLPREDAMAFPHAKPAAA